MGTYLNPGKQSFQIAVNSEIYVDKTEMIRYLNSLINTQQRFISVSRPRRFGKTMAADMISAYYDREADSRGLFEKRKLAQSTQAKNEKSGETWDSYLGKFDVIRVVMTDFIREDETIGDALGKLACRILDEMKEKYPGVKYDPSDFCFSMDKFYQKTGVQFVIVIDEWDAVFRVRKEDTDGQNAYLNFIRDWLKDKPYVALAYMTGILPIKKYGKHSALNMFDEYSMLAPMQLASYTGFTEEEVRELCDGYGRDYQKIKDWYDGYVVSDIIPPDPECRALRETGCWPTAKKYSLYSPLSVVKAVRTGRIMNYWNKTETYEALAEYIRKDYDGLKDAVALLMDGGRLRIDPSTYQNDMTTFSGRDDILSLLVHLGYLGFDDERSEVFIPNREILDEFRTSTKSGEWLDTFESFRISQSLLKATWAEEADKVAELLENAHNRAGNKTYHDETALSYAIQYAYYAAQKYYTIIPEMDTGKGYADLICLPAPEYPDKPALLIELKYNQDADTAIKQIKRQKYPERLEHYRGNILLVGIDYDRDADNSGFEFKHHSCRMERA